VTALRIFGPWAIFLVGLSTTMVLDGKYPGLLCLKHIDYLFETFKTDVLNINKKQVFKTIFLVHFKLK